MVLVVEVEFVVIAVVVEVFAMVDLVVVVVPVVIPHICHFFTRTKFLDQKIYTEKRVNYDK